MKSIFGGGRLWKGTRVARKKWPQTIKPFGAIRTKGMANQLKEGYREESVNRRNAHCRKR